MGAGYRRDMNKCTGTIPTTAIYLYIQEKKRRNTISRVLFSHTLLFFLEAPGSLAYDAYSIPELDTA